MTSQNTYIWSNDTIVEYNYFVAIADSVEQARLILVEEIENGGEYYAGGEKQYEEHTSFSYYQEWIDFITQTNPIVLSANQGGVFSHANE